MGGTVSGNLRYFGVGFVVDPCPLFESGSADGKIIIAFDDDPAGRKARKARQ